jgi:hypothetical protein
LEIALTRADTTSSRLFDVLLDEALESAAGVATSAISAE